MWTGGEGEGGTGHPTQSVRSLAWGYGRCVANDEGRRGGGRRTGGWVGVSGDTVTLACGKLGWQTVPNCADVCRVTWESNSRRPRPEPSMTHRCEPSRAPKKSTPPQHQAPVAAKRREREQHLVDEVQLRELLSFLPAKPGSCTPTDMSTTVDLHNRDTDHSTVVNNNGHVNNLVQRAATADPAQFSAVSPQAHRCTKRARQQPCPRTGQNQIPATAETPQFSVPPRHAQRRACQEPRQELHCGISGLCTVCTVRTRLCGVTGSPKA